MSKRRATQFYLINSTGAAIVDSAAQVQTFIGFGWTQCSREEYLSRQRAIKAIERREAAQEYQRQKTIKYQTDPKDSGVGQ